MYGRVVPFKDELKFREFDTYRAHYCGICAALRERGYVYAMTLSYDMTFLAILLNSLYETGKKERQVRCVCHPCKKHCEIADVHSEYVADMSILMAYYKCLDDFHDDKSIVKLAYSKMIKNDVERIEAKYPKKCENIKLYLKKLENAENDSLEEAANLFGEILGEVFTPHEDEWKDILYKMGFYMGKFIYIADACDDIEDDIKKKRHNPLIKIYSMPDFEKECEIIMNMMAAECAAQFEKLPILDNAEILRNIIYSGIWQKKAKKKQHGKMGD